MISFVRFGLYEKVSFFLIVPIAVVVLGFMVYGSMSGCGCEEEKVTVNFHMDTGITQRQVEDGICWDVTLDIEKTTPDDQRVRWENLRIIIKSQDGTVLNVATPPEPNDPSRYSEGNLESLDAQFWYVDRDSDRIVDPGDQIIITSLIPEYEGSFVVIIKFGETVGTFTLPQSFP
jgi:hypothetical protein